MLQKEQIRIMRALTAAALIVALAAFAGCTLKRQAKEDTSSKAPATQPEAPSVKRVEPTEQPDALSPMGTGSGVGEEIPDDQAQASPHAAKAKLAIVIDDFGYRNEATARIIALSQPITCAVLPDARTTAEDGLDAYNAGKMVILHMPMEAIDASKSQGEGFIRAGMDSDSVKAMLSEALLRVPMAQGVSNHMGSKASMDKVVMRAILEEVRDRGLFYLDSRTTSDTVGPEVARQVGTEAYINNVFIDSVDDVEYVKGKLREAANRAVEDGQAVAIGHVKLSTAKALEEVLPEIIGYGVELVFLDELVPL